jgi:hypothetical protein
MALRLGSLFAGDVYVMFGGNKRKDRPEGGLYIEENPETAKTLDTAGLNPTAQQGGVLIVIMKDEA